MHDYQKRVVDEKNDLDANLGRLLVFVSSPTFKALGGVERELLLKQSLVMGQYSNILEERIVLFGNPTAKPPQGVIEGCL